MGVLADVKVDLGDCLQANRAVRVQQQGDVHSVAGDERQALQQFTARRDLAREWLLDRGEVGIEHVQEGPGGELCDPPAAVGKDRLADPERPPVEALHERDPRLAHEWSEQAGCEVSAEALGVGVEEADQLATQYGEGTPHRVAFAQDGPERGHQVLLVVNLGP